MSDDFDVDQWAAGLSPAQLKLWTSPEAREVEGMPALMDLTGLSLEELQAEAYLGPEANPVEQWSELHHALRLRGGNAARRRRAAQRRVAEESGDGFYGNPFTLQGAPAGLPRELPDTDEGIDFATVEEAARYSARTFTNPDHPHYNSEDAWDVIWRGEASVVLLLALFEELVVDGIGRLAQLPSWIGPYSEGGELGTLRFVDELLSGIEVAAMNGAPYPEPVVELILPLEAVADRLEKPDRHEFFADAFPLSREERRVWMRLNAEHAHKPYNFPAKVRPKPRP